MYRIFLYFIIFFFFSFNLFSADNKIIVASTTSTYDTGLLTYLNKIFKDQFNINDQDFINLKNKNCQYDY